MKTIALRFAENFAPQEGTIAAHQEVIDQNGFVWYGKLGSSVSNLKCAAIMNNETPKILLIHSGQQNRYWAFISEIRYEVPDKRFIPLYYRDRTDRFHTWFKIVKFEKASKDIMQNCTVVSSGTPLSEASKSSMSPYFFIDATDEKVNS